MSPRRRAGVSTPALPVPAAPAFKISEVVYDTFRNQRVRIVLVIRHERIDFKCAVLHIGAHTRECERRSEFWYQYCVTPDIRMGRHNNARRLFHRHERSLSPNWSEQ